MGSDTGISGDLENFPSEFVLFASHVSTLVLHDRIRGIRREITQRTVEDCIELREGSDQSLWKVFPVFYSPTPEARREAGELADREVLPLHWAVPLDGRTGRGKFWAFFPTSLEMGPSGILNAPWKTNVDRQYLLPSKINQELIRQAATLVVQSLAQLVKQDDPGAILGVLPGRLDESPPWADRLLNTSIYEKAKNEKSIPNQFGKLSCPTELNFAPAHLPQEAYAAWSELDDRPAAWPHPSCESRERRSRMERLFGNRVQPSSISEWLEALVVSETPKSSIAALKVAAILWRSNPAIRAEVQNSRIVLTSSGKLVCAVPAKVFLPGGSTTASSAGLTFVHSVVVWDQATADFLREIGITECDETGEFRSFIADGVARFGVQEWERFWKLVAAMPDQVGQSLRGRDDLDNFKVKTTSGEFHSRRLVLLPGVIADTEHDSVVAVDTEYHTGCDAIFSVLNLHEQPVVNAGSLRVSSEFLMSASSTNR